MAMATLSPSPSRFILSRHEDSSDRLCGHSILNSGSGSDSNDTVFSPLIDPPYQKNFEWEKFDHLYWEEWMGQRWWWGLVFGALYLAAIFLGQELMRERKAKKVKNILFCWNVSLAVFSLSAFLRTFPEMWTIFASANGFHNTVCSRDQMSMAHTFWEWMGTWSKVVELGDTAFIILRKQPLIFLHWYHHTSVLIYTWFSIGAYDPAHRWYMSMNSLVHFFMYSYYALRAIGVKIPRKLAFGITSIQILQMVTGFAVNIYTVYAQHWGMDCCRPLGNVLFALLMYSSYLILFLNFFAKTYFGAKVKSKAE